MLHCVGAVAVWCVVEWRGKTSDLGGERGQLRGNGGAESATALRRSYLGGSAIALVVEVVVSVCLCRALSFEKRLQCGLDDTGAGCAGLPGVGVGLG